MKEFKKVLEIPVDDLKARRKVLEEELAETVTTLLFTDVKEKVNKTLEEFGVKGSEISWEFHPESDDEGGTDWWISYIQVKDEDGELLDIDDISIDKKSRYSDNTYEHCLSDELSELMYDYKDDLYEYDIEEISLN